MDNLELIDGPDDKRQMQRNILPPVGRRRMTVESVIPTGSEFLPGYSKNKLLEMRKHEKDAKTANVFLMYAKRREGGKDISQTAREVAIPHSAVHSRLFTRRADGRRWTVRF